MLSQFDFLIKLRSPPAQGLTGLRKLFTITIVMLNNGNITF
ncbi:hypothetical protein SPLC1_S541550 [Arthrospira platensis C1]|nr:hypothetical protein SPLC1_S541550 [Arthrospira platensis C1]